MGEDDDDPGRLQDTEVAEKVSTNAKSPYIDGTEGPFSAYRPSRERRVVEGPNRSGYPFGPVLVRFFDPLGSRETFAVMMRQMREATKPIMLFTALAFVALMVFEWGMDITGQSSGSYGEIGSVNGDPVMYESYMAAYQQLRDQVQASQEGIISSQQDAEIEDAAFDEVVNQILIRQELERRGITVTDQEVSEAAQFTPPEYLRPQFTGENGQFDLAAYQGFLASLPPDQLVLLEAYYRDVIPRGKLLRQVSSGIYLSEAELWQRWKDQNEQVEIRYVPMDPGTRYPDEEFTISGGDIEAYYRANQEEFEIPARATARVVVLDKTPTPSDTAAALERARTSRQEILDGADFAEVAARESSDEGSAARGGELGVFESGTMMPRFDSVAFAAPLGRVTEPVQTSYGYHLIEVMERWGADSAQARHVLIPIVRTDESEIELLTLADSVEELTEAMPLQEAAAQAGLTATTVDVTETFPFVAGAGQITEGAEWIFEDASPGDVSPVFETSQAFYALELVSAQPAGVLPLEDARESIVSTLRFDQKMARAREEAAQLVDRVRSGTALANAASQMGLEVRDAGPFSRTDFVPGIGRQNAAIGAAFGLGVDELSDVVSTPANAYVIQMLDRVPADSAAWLDQLDQQRQTAVATVQQERLQEWITALRGAARIVDRRDEVLQQPEEEPIQMPMVF